MAHAVIVCPSRNLLNWKCVVFLFSFKHLDSHIYMFVDLGSGHNSSIFVFLLLPYINHWPKTHIFVCFFRLSVFIWNLQHDLDTWTICYTYDKNNNNNKNKVQFECFYHVFSEYSFKPSNGLVQMHQISNDWLECALFYQTDTNKYTRWLTSNWNAIASKCWQLWCNTYKMCIYIYTKHLKQIYALLATQLPWNEEVNRHFSDIHNNLNKRDL